MKKNNTKIGFSHKIKDNFSQKVHFQKNLVIVEKSGVVVKAESSRRAKVSLKNILNAAARYDENIKQFLSSERSETKTAALVAKIDQSDLEEKYRSIISL